MVLKLWEVSKGRITFLVHVNSKNESRIVKLKEHIDCDNVTLLSDLDKAIELMTNFVTSVKKLNSIGIGDVTEVKQLDKTVEVEKSGNAEKTDVVNVEKDQSEDAWAWGNDLVSNDTNKDVPKEVNDKLGALLERDIGKPTGAQYLLHKNARVGGNKGKNHSHISGKDDTTDIDIVQKDKIVREKKDKDRKGGKKSKYDAVVSKLLPEILEGIEKSENKTVTMKISDILARMDEGISVSKNPGNVYTGLKLGLFAHNIVADRTYLEESDPTKEGKARSLIMRIRNETDTLPGYILRNRSKSRVKQ